MHRTQQTSVVECLLQEQYKQDKACWWLFPDFIFMSKKEDYSTTKIMCLSLRLETSQWGKNFFLGIKKSYC